MPPIEMKVKKSRVLFHGEPIHGMAHKKILEHGSAFGKEIAGMEKGSLVLHEGGMPQGGSIPYKRKNICIDAAFHPIIRHGKLRPWAEGQLKRNRASVVERYMKGHESPPKDPTRISNMSMERFLTNVDLRNAVMAKKILEHAEGKDLHVFVGDQHIKGTQYYLKNPSKIEETLSSLGGLREHFQEPEPTVRGVFEREEFTPEKFKPDFLRNKNRGSEEHVKTANALVLEMGKSNVNLHNWLSEYNGLKSFLDYNISPHSQPSIQSKEEAIKSMQEVHEAISSNVDYFKQQFFSLREHAKNFSAGEQRELQKFLNVMQGRLARFSHAREHIKSVIGSAA